MASITDNLKDGLKYPLYEPKKIGIFAVLLFIICVLVLSSVTIFLNSLKTAIDMHMLIEGTNLLPTFIPASSSIEIVIFLIIALIISFFVTGYVYEVLKSTIEGKNTLPEFNNFGNMFINGIKLVVVGVIYSIIPSVIWNLTFKFCDPGSAIGIILILISVILGIILALMTIMAINNMAVNDNRFKAAFDFNKILALISSIGWIRFLGAIIFLVLVGIIILFAFTFVAIIIAIICSFAGKIGAIIGAIIAL
ncbi:MAG: DUF4013 domain-containing protein, partial [Methanobacteriaceae archaeon]|nr:DUF4013 domain-containing protein [Methanobacteriaceae archaeon]